MKAVDVEQYYYIDIPCNHYSERIALDALSEKCSRSFNRSEVLFKNKQSAINAAKFALTKMASGNKPYKMEFNISNPVETYNCSFFNVSLTAHFSRESTTTEVVRKEVIIDGTSYYNESVITLPLSKDEIENYTVIIFTKEICTADDIFSEEITE